MRFVAASFLTLAFLAIPAASHAEETYTAPQARLAAVFSQTGQALLFDSIRGEYVVVRVGATFQGHKITSLNSRQIVLTAGTNQNYVLPLVAFVHPTSANPAARSTNATTVKVSPLPRPGDSLVDPYASPEPAPKITPKRRPRVATLPPTIVLPTASRVTKTELLSVRRKDLDLAFSDFGARSKEIRIRLANGKIHIKDVSRGSFFHRIGLRPGDVILTVAGKKITGIEVAAEVYAQLMHADRVELVLDRGNQRITYRYRLTK